MKKNKTSSPPGLRRPVLQKIVYPESAILTAVMTLSIVARASLSYSPHPNKTLWRAMAGATALPWHFCHGTAILAMGMSNNNVHRWGWHTSTNRKRKYTCFIYLQGIALPQRSGLDKFTQRSRPSYLQQYIAGHIVCKPNVPAQNPLHQPPSTTLLNSFSYV